MKELFIGGVVLVALALLIATIGSVVAPDETLSMSAAYGTAVLILGVVALFMAYAIGDFLLHWWEGDL